MSTDRDGLAFKPLYFGDRLDVINPWGDIGLVTLWTPVETARRIIAKTAPQLLDPDSRIVVIANLRGNGMHQMLCNLLYNPQIRHLVAVGEEMNVSTVPELEVLFRRGVEKAEQLGATVLKVPGTGRYFMDLEDFDADRLRRVQFAYLGRLSGPEVVESLAAHVRDAPHHAPPVESDRVRVEIPPAKLGTTQPSEVTSHQISRSGVLECWRELVTRTVRFGHPVELSDGARLELLNARVVIRAPQDDRAEELADYGFRLDRLHSYQESMFTAVKPEEISYTYGNRLGGYFMTDGRPLDTVARAVEILRRNPESRNAYVSLWDTAHDLAPGGPAATPCLVTLFFRRTEERLSLTATYRSHNLMTAWVPNIYGLMAIQRKVAEGTRMPIGPITVISHSLGLNPGEADLMERAQRVADAWDRDDDIDPETGKRELRMDPNGYFTVDVDERSRQIHVQHWYKDLPINEYRGKRAAVIERAIIGDMAVSLVSHALWLGRELARAEERLRRLPEEQDR